MQNERASGENPLALSPHKAKITSKAGAVYESELPANIHALHHTLTEMGIRKTPRSILLMDDNAADVELTADNEIGSGLLRVFGRNDTLADAITSEEKTRKKRYSML